MGLISQYNFFGDYEALYDECVRIYSHTVPGGDPGRPTPITTMMTPAELYDQMKANTLCRDRFIESTVRKVYQICEKFMVPYTASAGYTLFKSQFPTLSYPFVDNGEYEYIKDFYEMVCGQRVTSLPPRALIKRAFYNLHQALLQSTKNKYLGFVHTINIADDVQPMADKSKYKDFSGVQGEFSLLSVEQLRNMLWDGAEPPLITRERGYDDAVGLRHGWQECEVSQAYKSYGGEYRWIQESYITTTASPIGAPPKIISADMLVSAMPMYTLLPYPNVVYGTTEYVAPCNLDLKIADTTFVTIPIFMGMDDDFINRTGTLNITPDWPIKFTVTGDVPYPNTDVPNIDISSKVTTMHTYGYYSRGGQLGLKMNWSSIERLRLYLQVDFT